IAVFIKDNTSAVVKSSVIGRQSLVNDLCILNGFLIICQAAFGYCGMVPTGYRFGEYPVDHSVGSKIRIERNSKKSALSTCIHFWNATNRFAKLAIIRNDTHITFIFGNE